MYDRSSKLISEVNAAGGQYDERGWLSQKVNGRGQNTRYQYDASGRLIESSDDAGTVQLDYTKDGQVTSIAEGEVQTQYTYNEIGHLLSSTDSFGNQIQYAYDEAGRLTTLTYPDRQQVEYRYNASGELIEVKDWKGRLTRYRYDQSGKLIETNRPNGSREQRSYDAAGRLERLTDADVHGIRLQQYTYRYSAGGQLIQEEEKQYTYDGLRRLINGSWQGRRIQYSYDLAGNVTEVADNTVNTALSMHYTGDNRLQRVGEFPVEMDADGNLLYVTDGETMAAYEYDARNRLIQAGKHRYRYSAQGHRIEQTVRGKSTRYVIDESQELTRTRVLMEIDSTGQIKARYVYGLGLIGREDADGGYHCYHTDMRGSTTLLSDETGKVTDRYTYGIYGELEKHEGPTHQPFCYNGRDGVMTDANGLYYMRARYYDPKLKRFINRDVIRGDVLDGQTFNRYAYVNGDPVSFIDPLGLMKCEIEGTRKPDDDIIKVNPKDVNFAQVSINKSFDTPNGKIPITKVIKQGPDQVKNFPPISVVNVKGQLVARDGNSRLYVAQKTKAEKINVRIEKDFESVRDLTKRLRNNGLPNEGTKKPPTPR